MTIGRTPGARTAQALPRRLGAYELLSVLGEGGMGTVFRARHVPLDVVRAVKTLRARPSATGAARFAREVDALARVRHENVVAVHEVGSEGETDYYAMDLVEGRPLDDVLRGGPLPLDRALDVAAQAGRGVGALHAAGIVHRDLKPQNVVLRPDGRVVVIDLGLAVAPERDQRLTATGQLLGTPTYMAPEQVGGARTTPATDVHALGLLLFELATGREAFEGETVHEVVARVVSGERPAPSSVDVGLPDALDALVARATALDPARRPADGAAFAAEVERLRASPGPTARAARARRLARGLALALALAAVVAGASWLVALRPSTATPPAPASGPPPSASTSGVVSVRSPAPGHITWGESVELAVAVEGGAPRGPLRLRASRAGAVEGAVEAQALPGAPTRLRVPLRAGVNEVVVQALRSGAPWGRAAHVTIERRGAPPWFHALAEDRRPPCALEGVVPEALPGRYRNERDGSLLAWVTPGDVTVTGSTGLERGTLERGVLLGLHEVTNAQVRRFRADWRLRPVDVVGLPLEDDLPAALDWFEAHAYCRWAGLRLPRDLEWLRAAASSDGRRYPWGSREPEPDQVNALGSSAGRQLAPVLDHHTGDEGPFGHLGLGGNAREWVQERVAPGRDEPPVQAERLLRGSSAGERFESAELGLRRGLPPSPVWFAAPAEDLADRAHVGLRVALGPGDPPRLPRDLGWTVRAARAVAVAPGSRAELDALLAAGGRLEARLEHLDLRMGPLGPGHVLRARGGGALDPTFPVDAFVVVATCAPVVPAGRWLVVARADDSVRVFVDGALRIDAWAAHGERVDVAAFEVASARPVDVRVEFHEVAHTAILAVDLVAD